MQVEGPLLCFTSSIVEAETVSILKMNRDTNDNNEYVISCCKIIKWIGEDNRFFYTTLVRPSTGRGAVITIVHLLSETFRGPILVFDHKLAHSIPRNTHRICIVKDTSDVAEALNYPLGPDQRLLLKHALFERHQWKQKRRRRSLSDRIFLGVDDQDQLALAQTLSLESYESSSNDQPKKKRSLPADWPCVLKPAVLLSSSSVSHEAVCLTCTEKVATVCFVPCGHQVLCDDCVRTMWEMQGVARKCPVCTQEPESIVRPVTSERVCV